ncbi:MAG: methionine adenosyltransferase [Oscillospiraceae bacterium]
MTKKYTAESVTEGHPDKLCDLIADSVLDDCLLHDASSRVACEVLATKGHIIVAGEITSKHEPDIEGIVCKVLSFVGCNEKTVKIESYMHRQSPDIAAGVDNSLEMRHGVSTKHTIGAGDQGVMVGYACNETQEMLPLPVVLAQRITGALTAARKTGSIQGILPDGKAQVTVEYEDGKAVRLDTVIVSCQHSADVPLDWLQWEIANKILFPALRSFPPDENTRILINPSGRFVCGSIDADTGLTGRKLMADSYGGIVAHGGGAFSGKDATKVDRSGAYMARYIAKNMVAAGFASQCQITLAYAIGVAEPVMVEVETFGTGKVCADDCLAAAIPFVFDLTPSEIIKQLDLLKPIYKRTAVGGHFGRSEFTWERIDKIRALKEAVL